VATSGSPLSLLLEQHLSAERIRPYRLVVGGDLDAAIALYQWNGAMAAALGEDLGHLEVVLRNALHHQLTVWHAGAGLPGQWYDPPLAVLDQRRRQDIAEARSRLKRAGKLESPGRVVSELMFGFWRFLLDSRYQTTLWAQALRKAFPHLVPQRRIDVYRPVNTLYMLRNRIAHQEPIHQLNLADHHRYLLLVAGFIDPGIEAWLGGNSRVPPMLAGRPAVEP
jgi:hypothetical protein